MDPADIRRWAADYRAAASRVSAEAARHPLGAREAFSAAMALLAFDEALNGSPFERRDPVGEREDAEAREAWTRLRARWSNDR